MCIFGELIRRSNIHTGKSRRHQYHFPVWTNQRLQKKGEHVTYAACKRLPCSWWAFLPRGLTPSQRALELHSLLYAICKLRHPVMNLAACLCTLSMSLTWYGSESRVCTRISFSFATIFANLIFFVPFSLTLSQILSQILAIFRQRIILSDKKVFSYWFL